MIFKAGTAQTLALSACPPMSTYVHPPLSLYPIESTGSVDRHSYRRLYRRVDNVVDWFHKSLPHDLPGWIIVSFLGLWVPCNAELDVYVTLPYIASLVSRSVP